MFRAPAVIEIPRYKEICRSCKSLKQKSSEIFSLAQPAHEYKLLQIYRMKIGEIHLIKTFHFSLPAEWTRMWLSRIGYKNLGSATSGSSRCCVCLRQLYQNHNSLRIGRRHH